MKKLTALILAMTLIMGVSAFAKSPTVFVNGEQLTFDAEPFIENDRALVPVRAIFKACGAEMSWDQDTLTAVGYNAELDRTVTIQAGNKTAFVDSEAKELDVAARVLEDRTYVPLRFISEAMDAKVDWDGENFRIDITIER